DDDEAEIVGKDVYVVERWNREGGFEFARQVSFPVKRVNEVRLGFGVELQLLTINPDAVIGRSFGREGVGQLSCFVQNEIHQRTGGWRGRRHHVTFDIPAGSDS